MTLFLGGCSSTYHLAVIAWERYVAIRKWTEYKVIVTRGRVKKYARIAWLVAVVVAILPRAMKLKFFEVPYKYRMIASLVGVIPGAVSIILIGYFYILVYLGVRKRQCLEKATRRAKTAPLMTRSLQISECELDGYERKSGPKILSVTTKGSTTHRALLKPSHSPPKSSWQREIRRSKSLAGHECQQKKTKLRPKRVLSASRNKEVTTFKLIGQTASTRKLHLNVTSDVSKNERQGHDLEDNTKQLQASRFQAPLRTQSASLRRKGFQHQSRENIILESWDEHDPFTEMEMQSACSQNSARSDTKTEDIDTNFISK